MKVKNTKRITLDKSLFWDIDYKSLDFDKNKEFIIGRVLNSGDIDDFQVIEKIYSFKEIASISKRIRQLDPKSLNFWSRIFNIPKKEFYASRNT